MDLSAWVKPIALFDIHHMAMLFKSDSVMRSPWPQGVQGAPR